MRKAWPIDFDPDVVYVRPIEDRDHSETRRRPKGKFYGAFTTDGEMLDSCRSLKELHKIIEANDCVAVWAH